LFVKDGSAEEIQEYLFSIGYTWKREPGFDFGDEYKKIKTFWKDIIIILLDNKTFAWESYSNYQNQYMNIMFGNTSITDNVTFLQKRKRKDKLNKINKKYKL
jgi:hypothetical protein